MSAASCSRSTRGWGVPRAFLKLCGFFKSGAPSPPPPTGPPTTGRCTPSLVRVAFSPSRFLPAAFICVAIRPSLFISSYLAPLPSPSLSLHTLTLSPLSRPSATPLRRSSMPLALFPTRSPASACLASSASLAMQPRRMHRTRTQRIRIFTRAKKSLAFSPDIPRIEFPVLASRPRPGTVRISAEIYYGVRFVIAARVSRGIARSTIFLRA